MKRPTALITGASGGIGKDLALIHAAHGHNLVLVARSEEKLRELKWEAGESHGIEALVLPADLSETGAPERLHRKLQNEDIAIEYLVNNAGIGDFGLFRDSDWEKQEAMIRLNITSLTRLTHLFLPPMVRRGHGRVMNVASTAGFYPGPLMSVYYATKNYVVAFSEALSEELKGSGVTVTALCPGPTRSGFQERAEMHDSRLFKLSPVASSREVAQYGFRQMMKGKTVAVHGLGNKISVQLRRLAPRWLIRKAVRLLQDSG